MKTRILFILAMVVLTALSLAFAARRNWTPDAVTRATTFNEYVGDLAVLFDGKQPDNDASPASFTWQGKGILVFEFPEPVELAQFRVYVGEWSGRYTLKAYLGGRTTDDGAGRDPAGELKVRLEVEEVPTNQWVTFELPPGTVIDNVEFRAIGRSEYYEIELLGPEETPVRPTSWGVIKAQRDVKK